MKEKLINPLWTHLPALAVVVYFITRLITALPLPSSVPIHFNAAGNPDSYGSPWIGPVLAILFMIGYIILLMLEDEKWARSEARKTFNWNSIIDEIVVAFVVGLGLGYLDYLKSGAILFNFPLVYIVTTIVISVILGLIVEVLRPFHPQSGLLIAEDIPNLQKELENRIKDGGPLFYGSHKIRYGEDQLCWYILF
jgi:hypothetical protein